MNSENLYFCYKIQPINSEKISVESDLLFVTGRIFTNIAELYYYHLNKPEEEQISEIDIGKDGYILKTLDYTFLKKI